LENRAFISYLTLHHALPIMPLANFGTLVLHHLVFVAHLVYFHIAFSHMEPSALVVLYCVSKLLARRADDIDGPPPEWPPPGIQW
jgi:hypothetical protein